MKKFYNPYHFIPFGDVSKVAMRRPGASGAADHSLYAKNTYSGRLILRISNPKTPLVTGNLRTSATKTEPAVTEQYAPGELREPALPGSALRGCIGSLIEAASGSAMRVLDDRPVPGSTMNLHEYIEKSIGKNLRPMHSRRASITPAERLLGFVDLDEAGSPDEDRKTRALAGRLRFHDAILRDRPSPVFLDAVPLRVLNTPKGKYPWFYYGVEGPDPKLDPTPNKPLGRKHYLLPQKPGEEHWKADPSLGLKPEQYTIVKPLASKCVFYTHVEFDNLEAAELRWLLYALSPAPGFVHRLGLGKPIGLGCVEIGIVAVRIAARANRYTLRGLLLPRYTAGWTLADEDPNRWPSCCHEDAANMPAGFLLDQELAKARASVDRTVHNAICLFGAPGTTAQHPVHTPIRETQQHYDQDSTYRWFQENAKAKKPQRLRPLHELSTSVPPLESN